LRTRGCRLPEAPSPQLKSCGKAILARIERQEIQTKWLFGFEPNGCGSFDDAQGSNSGNPSTKTPRFRHRSYQSRRRGRTHATERDRMFDVQQVADCRSDHDFHPETE
jgi:hypothetical protein